MTNQNGYAEVLPREIARFAKMAMGKGGSSKPPFPKIDLVFVPPPAGGETRILQSIHRNAASTAQARIALYRVDGEGGFETAIGRPDRFLDFIEGLFAPDRPVRLGPDAGDGKVNFTNGLRSGSIATCAMTDVPRPTARKGADPTQWHEVNYGLGPDALYVATDPKKRPAPGSDWPVWAEGGYTVAQIPLAELTALLNAGGILMSHGYRNAILTFRFDDGKMSVLVRDPFDDTAEKFAFDQTAGTVFGKPSDSFSLLYQSVEAQLASLAYVENAPVVIVTHPAEARVSFLMTERDDKKNLVLTVNQTVAKWADPRLTQSVI